MLLITSIGLQTAKLPCFNAEDVLVFISSISFDLKSSLMYDGRVSGVFIATCFVSVIFCITLIVSFRSPRRLFIVIVSSIYFIFMPQIPLCGDNRGELMADFNHSRFLEHFKESCSFLYNARQPLPSAPTRHLHPSTLTEHTFILPSPCSSQSFSPVWQPFRPWCPMHTPGYHGSTTSVPTRPAFR